MLCATLKEDNTKVLCGICMPMMKRGSMARSRILRGVSMSLFMVALVWFAALGVTAFAAPGDSGANATSLNDIMGSNLTTMAIPGGIPGSSVGYYYFKVLLSPGQTMQADFTSLPGLSSLSALADPFNTYSALTPSVQLSAEVQRLTFSAPASTPQIYTVYVGTSGPGRTFTVEPRMVVPGTLSGTVTADGSSLSGVTVSVPGYASATTGLSLIHI